jgi:hypothetical protein
VDVSPPQFSTVKGQETDSWAEQVQQHTKMHTNGSCKYKMGGKKKKEKITYKQKP